MPTHYSCHYQVITSQVIRSPVAVKVKVGLTKKSTMAKEESDRGEFLNNECVDHNRKRIGNLSKANAVKEKVIHSDLLVILPIFPY